MKLILHKGLSTTGFLESGLKLSSDAQVSLSPGTSLFISGVIKELISGAIVPRIHKPHVPTVIFKYFYFSSKGQAQSLGSIAIGEHNTYLHKEEMSPYIML